MDILAEIDWQPLLKSDGPPLLLMIAMGIVIIAVVVAVQWRRVRIGEAEAGLKVRMIERGYSPEQIGQVLQARMSTARLGRCRENEFLSPAST